MTHYATDGDIDSAADRALARFERRVGTDFWADLHGHRDDARQEALVRAWKASVREGEHQQSAGAMSAWLYKNAKHGLMSYVRELREDRDKRSPTCVVRVGLDDEEVRYTLDEAFPDDEEYDGPRPESEALYEEVEEISQSQIALRTVLDAALMGALDDTERRAVRLYYGLDDPMSRAQGNTTHVSYRLKVSPRTAGRLIGEGLDKLRAELQADKIMEL